MSKYPNNGANMSTREVEPLIHGFVASLVELVEANVAHRLQEAIASVLVDRGVAPKKKTVQAATRPLPVANSVRRGPTPTPKMVQARKIQGQYMAAVRGLKPADRNRVKKLTSAKGAVAGLALARSLGQTPKPSRKSGRPLLVVKSSGDAGETSHHSESIR
jgi:hypothetical protein